MGERILLSIRVSCIFYVTKLLISAFIIPSSGFIDQLQVLLIQPASALPFLRPVIPAFFKIGHEVMPSVAAEGIEEEGNILPQDSQDSPRILGRSSLTDKCQSGHAVDVVRCPNLDISIFKDPDPEGSTMAADDL